MFLDDPRVSNVVFYPRKAVEPKREKEHIKVLKLTIHEKIVIGGILYLKNPILPTILLFHGNGEIALDYSHFYHLYFKCDVNLAVVDFRGYGFSSHQPTYTSLLRDAMPIYIEFQKYLKENNFTGSLFVQGRSLGSVCASEIGANNPEDLRGMIFESGFASIYNMMTRLFNINGPDITPEKLEKYSNHIRIKKFKKPTLVIHGSNDFIIPVSEGMLIFKTLPEDIDKKLLIIESAGHNDMFSYEKEYFEPFANFVADHKYI